MTKKKYNGWLVSNSIMKRSFAIMGHFYLAVLIMYGVIILFVAMIGLIGLLMGA